MVATDEELVARSMEGDVESFNQLVLRWERPIYALAYRVIARERPEGPEEGFLGDIPCILVATNNPVRQGVDRPFPA